MIAYHQIQNACRAAGVHATHYCLDYFTTRLQQTCYYFSHFLLYSVLRFVKPILLNEYDDDKTTRVCTL